jgi:hypothetical protein
MFAPDDNIEIPIGVEVRQCDAELCRSASDQRTVLDVLVREDQWIREGHSHPLFVHEYREIVRVVERSRGNHHHILESVSRQVSDGNRRRFAAVRKNEGFGHYVVGTFGPADKMPSASVVHLATSPTFRDTRGRGATAFIR